MDYHKNFVQYVAYYMYLDRGKTFSRGAQNTCVIMTSRSPTDPYSNSFLCEA